MYGVLAAPPPPPPSAGAARRRAAAGAAGGGTAAGPARGPRALTQPPPATPTSAAADRRSSATRPDTKIKGAEIVKAVVPVAGSSPCSFCHPLSRNGATLVIAKMRIGKAVMP
ncbi:Protein of unknown function [Gryllus bimaculatus]|nr:Protein of unknown function [Gryllus bimaculatus]